MPFWQALIPNMRYVICLRNPLGAASSAAKTPWMPSLESAIDNRILNTAAVIQHTAGQSRLFVFYEDFFADWQAEVRRLARFIGRPFPSEGADLRTEIEAYVQSDLRHHDSTLADTMRASAGGSAERRGGDIICNCRMLDGVGHFLGVLRFQAVVEGGTSRLI